MLEDLKREFTISANRIPNWRKMSKISIARGYVENENDELLKDSYFSAFALRFWHEIPTLYKECKFLVDRLSLSIEDIADWYIEGLLNVFKYRAFMNDKVYTYDEKGKEDKFINGYVYRAIDNVRERYFQYYNYDKRKSNINVSSLDQFVDDNGDSLLKDDVDLKYGDIDKVIRRLIENNDIYEALVMYSVTYGNSFSKVYEDGKCVAKYNPKKTSHLVALQSFCSTEYF